MNDSLFAFADRQTPTDAPAWSQPWGGKTPRRWQTEAVPAAVDAIAASKRGVISAIMGSGKSIAQARLCALTAGRIIVTVPTVALVDQLAATIAGQNDPETVGKYYTHAKQADRRITVCCLPSLTALVNDPAFTSPDLWIADEMHRTESDRIKAAHAAMRPRAAIGFTATPFRAKETEELSLWDAEVYEYGAGAAMRDGVVVRFDARPWQGESVDIDTACLAMIRDVMRSGPGLCNARDIVDAEAYAAILTANGIKAAAVHSRCNRADVTATMDRLKQGELACVVHVNMLAEGVDYPWLMWLCMRRPVQSRVRFCQEVGRVLRACDGKTKAILLDPHDLMNRFSLSYEAILAGMADDKADEPFDREKRDADQEWQGEGPEPEVRMAKRIAAWKRYLRALYFAGVAVGAIDATRVTSTYWRSHEPSDKQLDFATVLCRKLAKETSIPPGHRKLLAAIADNAKRLKKGDTSDLISICRAFDDARKQRMNLWAEMVKAVAADWAESKTNQEGAA